MKAINLTKVFKKYKGQWVALESPTKVKVVAYGKALKKVLNEAEQKGFKLPFMVQVPKEVLPIVGPYTLR